MLFSREIWQMTGALALSGILAFIMYILPFALLISCVVMLCMKKFREKRALLLALCAVFILWIVLFFVFLLR